MKGQNASYLNGDHSFTEIKKKDTGRWHSMGKQLYQGFRNGTYWIRFNGISYSSPIILMLNETHITHARLLYQSGEEILALENSRRLRFRIDSLKSGDDLFLKVYFKKEAILSYEFRSVESHYRKEANTNAFLGSYYGVVFLVLLINLVSFFNYGRQTYLHYVLMLSFISLGLAASDGFFNLVFPDKTIILYAEPFFNLCVSLSLPVLANSYMNLKKHIPGINQVGKVLAISSCLLFVAYLLTGIFLVFAFAELLALSLVTTYWVGGVIIWKKSLEARVFTIAYFIICFSCYDFYIARSFGFSFIGLTLDQFRIGAIVEMLVFTYAINYQGKLLLIENQKMRLQLSQFFEGDEGRELLNQERNAKLIKEFNLTPKEMAILQGISQGRINKEIANELNVSINTIKFHIKNIYQKLKASSRQEARKKYFSAIQ